jgi:hypothetical protein
VQGTTVYCDVFVRGGAFFLRGLRQNC